MEYLYLVPCRIAGHPTQHGLHEQVILGQHDELPDPGPPVVADSLADEFHQEVQGTEITHQPRARNDQIILGGEVVALKKPEQREFSAGFGNCFFR